MKISRLESYQLVDYEFSSIEEAKKKFHEWKNEYYKKNRLFLLKDHGKNDKAYKKYCQELDDILLKEIEILKDSIGK